MSKSSWEQEQEAAPLVRIKVVGFGILRALHHLTFPSATRFHRLESKAPDSFQLLTVRRHEQ
jgi:hypothetical protein